DLEKGNIRISGRANNYFVEKTGFNLAVHVFEKLQSEFGGSGGGHPAAAAFNGRATDLALLLRRCVELTAEFFSKKGKAQIKEYD
ncbi:MAG: DHH family phosphoesterase, partial [archaeon]|nr:DHH family phosphoesterase [archaeon]